MIGKFGSTEDGAAIENWQNLLPCGTHITVPKLEMTAVLFLPILVQVNQKINAPIEFELSVSIKVDMNF